MTGCEKIKNELIFGAILLTIIPAYAFADEESLKEQMKRLGIENDDWIEWEPENIDTLYDAREDYLDHKKVCDAIYDFNEDYQQHYREECEEHGSEYFKGNECYDKGDGKYDDYVDEQNEDFDDD